MLEPSKINEPQLLQHMCGFLYRNEIRPSADDKILESHLLADVPGHKSYGKELANCAGCGLAMEFVSPDDFDWRTTKV